MKSRQTYKSMDSLGEELKLNGFYCLISSGVIPTSGKNPLHIYLLSPKIYSLVRGYAGDFWVAEISHTGFKELQKANPPASCIAAFALEFAGPYLNDYKALAVIEHWLMPTVIYFRRRTPKYFFDYNELDINSSCCSTGS